MMGTATSSTTLHFDYRVVVFDPSVAGGYICIVRLSQGLPLPQSNLCMGERDIALLMV